jgi:glutathione peroxidase
MRGAETSVPRHALFPSIVIAGRTVIAKKNPRDFARAAGASARYSAIMIDRRCFLLLGSAALTVLAARSARATGMTRITAYAFTFKGLDGGEILLASYSGQPLLVVNTASQCGYTPQYAGLQALWTRYRARGLIVLGVPSNDFGGQEPGGVSDIHVTAQGQYHVTFPITDKVAVKGKDAHPFYKWAASERPLDGPRWNFHKYLIGRDGYLKGAFTSAVEPTDPLIVAAIEKELGAA